MERHSQDGICSLSLSGMLCCQHRKSFSELCAPDVPVYKLEKSCRITLKFSPLFQSPMFVDNGVYFTYGPFLMSLKIKEDVEIDEKEIRQTKEFLFIQPADGIMQFQDGKNQWLYLVRIR